MCAMRAQVHTEPECALHRGRVGPIVGVRTDPSRTDPPFQSWPAERAQQLGGESAPDDVSVTHEYDRAGLCDSPHELSGLAPGLGHPTYLANARSTARDLLPDIVDHLTELRRLRGTRRSTLPPSCPR